MRKLVVGLVFVFALAFGFGVTAPDAAVAAGGPGPNCTLTCSCSGQPLVCCPTSGGGVSCSPSTFHECPQVYNC